MTFLHLIRSMRIESGGPAEGVRLLMDVYRRLGHEAEIATLDPPSLDLSGIAAPVHKLGVRSDGYGRSPYLRPWLRDHAGRFSGVIVDGLWQYHGFAALRELRGRHPYVVFPHGMLDPWFNTQYPMKRLKKLPYWFLVERRLLQGSRAVLFTSKTERDLAPKSFPGSNWTAEVVPYGTLGPPGPEAQELAAFYERLPQFRDEPFFLFAGRLHPKKGCDMLLRAYASLYGRYPLPRLVFAGPDSVGWQARLQQMAVRDGIQDRVVWAGMLTGPAKWGAFRAAEAFVLPSHQENFGVVVAEALSCGTPVLLSDQVNIAANAERCGAALVEPDTLEGTICLLEGWMRRSVAQRAEMSRKGIACWRARFDSIETGKGIVKLFS